MYTTRPVNYTLMLRKNTNGWINYFGLHTVYFFIYLLFWHWCWYLSVNQLNLQFNNYYVFSTWPGWIQCNPMSIERRILPQHSWNNSWEFERHHSISLWHPGKEIFSMNYLPYKNKELYIIKIDCLYKEKKFLYNSALHSFKKRNQYMIHGTQ